MLPEQLKSDWMDASDIIGEAERGDLIEIKRTVKSAPYMHWVVYIGIEDGVHRVAHISTENSDIGSNIKEFISKLTQKIRPKVRFDELATVVGTDVCRINNSLDAHRKPFPPAIIIDRSRCKIGTGGYNLLRNNCEHFAKWCRYGIRESDQSITARAIAIGATSMVLTSSLSTGTVIGAVGYVMMKTRQRMIRGMAWSIV